MSRQAQLPPRCPLQKKNTTCQANKVGTILVEEQQQPEWLNDLLSDSESNSTVINQSQASSDSLTFSNGLDQVDDTETLDSSEPDDDALFESSYAYGPNSPRKKNKIVSAFLNGLDQVNDTETLDYSEPDDDRSFESGCAYGPNSPRMKNKPGFPGNKIVSAFSEYVMQSPLQRSDSLEDECASVGGLNTETKATKRHPGQRSRVRKLQYIAELERTVDILQNLGSELAVRVASLLQQHVALTMENNTLKQQLIRMQQEKFVVDGEYQSLMEELLRLKNNLASSHNKKVPNWSHSARFSHSDAIWEMDKLNLN